MKRIGKAISNDGVMALALTWDGARWPKQRLPLKARAFLSSKSSGTSVPAPQKAAKLLADDRVKELRICWVPQLKGGKEVLSEPFQTAAGMRLGFTARKTVRFGDILGVIYRRRRTK